MAVVYATRLKGIFLKMLSELMFNMDTLKKMITLRFLRERDNITCVAASVALERVGRYIQELDRENLPCFQHALFKIKKDFAVMRRTFRYSAK